MITLRFIQMELREEDKNECMWISESRTMTIEGFRKIFVGGVEAKTKEKQYRRRWEGKIKQHSVLDWTQISSIPIVPELKVYNLRDMGVQVLVLLIKNMHKKR